MVGLADDELKVSSSEQVIASNESPTNTSTLDSSNESPTSTPTLDDHIIAHYLFEDNQLVTDQTGTHRLTNSGVSETTDRSRKPKFSGPF